MASYQCFLPAAAVLMVKHGFKIRIEASPKFEWLARFKLATEKYSPQVHLDGEDNLTDYVAGMPFPFVTVDDPKAARKIAYNWHMGPLMPDDFSLAPWDSLATPTRVARSHSRSAANPTTRTSAISSIFSGSPTVRRWTRDRFGERGQEFEWKARCNVWNESAASAHGGAGASGFDLRALVWIDIESYVWLGAEFFESNMKTESAELQEVAFPLWRTRPAEEGVQPLQPRWIVPRPRGIPSCAPSHPEPASSTPVPQQPGFFRSVVPAHGPYDQKINAGLRDEAIFTPRSLAN